MIFRGGSCYPISPLKTDDNSKTKDKSETILDGNDQFIKILNKINIDKKDISFCTDV